MVTVFLAVLGCTAVLWICLAVRIHREGIGLRYAIWHDAAGRLRWKKCDGCGGAGVQWLHEGVIGPIPEVMLPHNKYFTGRRGPKVGNYMNCRVCNGTGNVVIRELDDPKFRDRLHDRRWPA